LALRGEPRPIHPKRKPHDLEPTMASLLRMASFGQAMKKAGIHWCAITRDGVSLVQWSAEPENMSAPEEVKALAEKIVAKGETPGFEYATLGTGIASSHSAIKFHVHEATSADWEKTVWAFHLVRDSNFPVERAKVLLAELVELTAVIRATPLWRTGGPGSCQASFAGELQRLLARANERRSDEPDATDMVRAKLEAVDKLMHDNIELLMARQDRLDTLARKGEELSGLSRTFYDRSRDLRRFKMWQDAKWGIYIGAAATVAATIIALPVLL